MKLGNVIRKHRKDLGMTQEKMANRLGVTAPAVNKWENGNTLPDITLLAPIARLFGITTDELLSFKDELTTKEIDNFVLQIMKDLKEKDYDTVFLLAKHKIEEYPNCENLILEIVSILHSHQIGMGKSIPNIEHYEDIMIEWCEQCLNSEDKDTRETAAISLYNIHLRRKNYEMALEYTKYYSNERFRKFSEATVYSKSNRKNEAYEIYEKLIFSSWAALTFSLNNLGMLYIEDNNHEMANKVANVSSKVATSLEVGYASNMNCIGLAVASWEKDVVKTEQIMRTKLDNVKQSGLLKSPLYQHVTFNEIGDDMKSILEVDAKSSRKRLVAYFKGKEFDYMRGNKWWEKLISSKDD